MRVIPFIPSWLRPFCFFSMGVFFLSVACQENPARTSRSSGDYSLNVNRDALNDEPEQFIYHLATPDHITALSPVLEEISGICLIDSFRMAGVQDEAGRVYVFRIENGKIERTIDFAKNGDFEDIAIAGNRLFILESNGSLYKIDDYASYNPGITKFQTPLKSKNDCEGLAYDPMQNALLIACKGSPSIQKDTLYEGFRAVYRFSLETLSMDSVPFMLIDINSLQQGHLRDGYEKLSYKLAGAMSSGGSIHFQPSGIAFHPVTQQYYILAHVGKIMIVADKEGQILQSMPVDPHLFTQPEGICFGPDGTLYISSEGGGYNAVIAVFHPKRQ